MHALINNLDTTPGLGLLLTKAAAIVLIFFCALGSGLYARARTQEPGYIPWGEATTSGIFLGVALFHMLPEAEKAFHHAHYPYAHLLCALGLVLLLGLKKGSAYWQQQYDHTYHKGLDQAAPPPTPCNACYLLMFILSIHSLIAGAALGIHHHISKALIVLIAIMAHKGLESFALVTYMQQHQANLRTRTRFLWVFSIMTPLGIAAASGVSIFLHQTHSNLLWSASLNALAAGTFLYLGLSSLYQTRKHLHPAHALLALITGFSAMALLAVWL